MHLSVQEEEVIASLAAGLQFLHIDLQVLALCLIRLPCLLEEGSENCNLICWSQAELVSSTLEVMKKMREKKKTKEGEELGSGAL